MLVLPVVAVCVCECVCMGVVCSAYMLNMCTHLRRVYVLCVHVLVFMFCVPCMLGVPVPRVFCACVLCICVVSVFPVSILCGLCHLCHSPGCFKVVRLAALAEADASLHPCLCPACMARGVSLQMGWVRHS